MENLPTDWCKSLRKTNFGLIWAVSGAPPSKNKLFWL